MAGSTFGRSLARLWPWLILAMAVWPAVWHAIDFPDDRDPEFPRVERPTFSRRPPPAYRLAEPGDTIDRIAIYTSAGALVLALAGLRLNRRRAEFDLWPAALGLALAAFWSAANPGPTFDGWHGLGWRAIAEPGSPLGLRLALIGAALGLAGLVVRNLLRERERWGELWQTAGERGLRGLLSAALVLAPLRQVEIPGVEPVGYWPRWAFVWGLIAFDLAMVRALPSLGRWLHWRRWALTFGGGAAWFGLVVGGIWLTWYHRPLSRLHTVEPGTIYISAMPTARGLAIAQGRHHFKTIINLFPEDTPERSARLPEELKFAREHGIRYLGNASDVAESDAFLDQTLAVAQDSDAWPILVHCHACQDRSPAWMGIYRFVVQGRPLNEILQEIERHRGYRPKASVTLLYNRVLAPRAPGRYASDPTAALLKRCAHGTRDPYEDFLEARARRANPALAPGVSRPTGPRASLPSLTPKRGTLEYQKTLRDHHPHEPANRS
jgi:hypothetical protein